MKFCLDLLRGCRPQSPEAIQVSAIFPTGLPVCASHLGRVSSENHAHERNDAPNRTLVRWTESPLLWDDSATRSSEPTYQSALARQQNFSRIIEKLDLSRAVDRYPVTAILQLDGYRIPGTEHIDYLVAPAGHTRRHRGFIS